MNGILDGILKGFIPLAVVWRRSLHGLRPLSTVWGRYRALFSVSGDNGFKGRAAFARQKEDEEERTMWEVLIGAAAGIAVAAAAILCYRRGLLDGRRRPPEEDAEEPDSALRHKYEAIMNYDPYGEGV